MKWIISRFLVFAMEMEEVTLLYEAALLGQAPVMRRLLPAGVDPDVTDYRGWTPLMFAAQEGHTNCIQLLLDSGASVNRSFLYEESPPWLWALRTGTISVLGCLLETGTEPNKELLKQSTPAKWVMTSLFDSSSQQGQQEKGEPCRNP